MTTTEHNASFMQRYRCQFCEETFHFKYNYKIHIKEQHKGEVFDGYKTNS